jgi:pimeloyl-ACP methyl ester carboxylesterase
MTLMNLTRNILWAGVAAFLGYSASAAGTKGLPSDERYWYSYEEHQVTFQNEPDSISLSGTLVIPDSPEPAAAVILIPSSSLDRDASTGRHRPFEVLAAHLARHGLITLRADSRGVGQSEGDAWPAVTKEDLASDAEAAIGYLKGRSEVDTTGIGLLGHSEGASVAAMVAGRSSDVSFIVMLAGPGLPGSRVLCSQIRQVAAAFGVGKPVIESHVELIEASAAILREHRDEAGARDGLRNLYDDYLHRTTEGGRSALTECGYAAPESSEHFAAGMLLPWMKDFMLYDPRPDLRRVRCPVLSMIGEKDMQVAAEENTDAIREALKQGGNSDAVVIELPGLNHMLQPAATGSPAEYEEIGEAISSSALEAITRWILTQRPQ